MRYDNNPVLSGISYFVETALMLLFIREFSTGKLGALLVDMQTVAVGTGAEELARYVLMARADVGWLGHFDGDYEFVVVSM